MTYKYTPCAACNGHGHIDVKLGANAPLETIPCGACAGRGKIRWHDTTERFELPPSAEPPTVNVIQYQDAKPKHAFKATKATSRALTKAAAMSPASLEGKTADAQMNFRIKAKTKAKLQVKADELGFSMSELIVELIERFLK